MANENPEHNGEKIAHTGQGLGLLVEPTRQVIGLVTGEVPIITDIDPPLTPIESHVLKSLVKEGVPLKVAVQTMQYDRLI